MLDFELSKGPGGLGGPCTSCRFHRLSESTPVVVFLQYVCTTETTCMCFKITLIARNSRTAADNVIIFTRNKTSLFRESNELFFVFLRSIFVELQSLRIGTKRITIKSDFCPPVPEMFQVIARVLN